MKVLKIMGIGLFGIIGFLVLTFSLGPRSEFALVTTDHIPFSYDLEDLDQFITDHDSRESTLKVHNGSQLYWADSLREKTEYSLLFLHGFTGTHHEANPLHKEFGERYGMNTYLHRIVDHGVSDPNAFKDLTPTDLMNSAKEGLEVAKLLGKKVVIMSCSTGSTYAAYLASYDKDISHMICLSPNIALYSSSAGLVSGPWGEKLVDAMFGDHIKSNQTELTAPFWQTEYHTDGIIALQALIDQTMREEVFKNITQPMFIGCYYKDEEHQDFVVSVDAMREFFNQIGTSVDDKIFQEFPNANNHVIGSKLKADNVEEVFEAVYRFGDRYFQ